MSKGFKVVLVLFVAFMLFPIRHYVGTVEKEFVPYVNELERLTGARINHVVMKKSIEKRVAGRCFPL